MKLQLRLPWRLPKVRPRTPSLTRRRKEAPPPFISLPHRRPLTAKDQLSTLDLATGERHYLPLVLRGEEGVEATGRYVGVGWMHCGALEGVLLVRAEEIGNPRAWGYWKALADGAVQVIEGSAV